MVLLLLSCKVPASLRCTLEPKVFGIGHIKNRMRRVVECGKAVQDVGLLRCGERAKAQPGNCLAQGIQAWCPVLGLCQTRKEGCYVPALP